ncbi:MAG: hypothetical protein AAFQ80_15450 [Cyanobacteria bacterium J06621_8]
MAAREIAFGLLYEEAEDRGEIEGVKIESKQDEQNPIAQTPGLPNLPDLEPADQYLLYSLLMHGDLTNAALAKSLGDLESLVHARVQVLRHEGIIEQRENILKINPIYYPRIKSELAANNFIITRS